MNLLYLTSLIVSLTCLALADHRWKLAFWRNSRSKKRTLATLCFGIVFFAAWDVAGVIKGIFATNSAFVSGVYLATPDLPLEEGLFLALLCYVTLLLYTGLQKRDSA